MRVEEWKAVRLSVTSSRRDISGYFSRFDSLSRFIALLELGKNANVIDNQC